MDKQSSWLQREFLSPLKLRKWLLRDVTALYSHFEEKQRVQIFHLVRIAFTECDGSIRIIIEVSKILKCI
ncbi:hypothetical protein C7M56_11075 [Clostridium botulinum]|uniref:Uncharacterized protein n=1 Tax=Clostridium botulinum TaxID=1491 RepID=A0ABC8CVQ2_CLOBO|nr:hypothetical protein C7M56_11075 [Clostridium botulinum]